MLLPSHSGVPCRGCVGLRSGNIYAPWPEEGESKDHWNHCRPAFRPYERAAAALRRVRTLPNDRIHVTGNTVVDALLTAKSIVDSNPGLSSRWDGIRANQGNRRIILVTCHRRENFGPGIQQIVDALLEILRREDVAIVLPVHPNPNVHDVLSARLSDHPRVELISPQEVLRLSACYLSPYAC